MLDRRRATHDPRGVRDLGQQPHQIGAKPMALTVVRNRNGDLGPVAAELLIAGFANHVVVRPP